MVQTFIAFPAGEVSDFNVQIQNNDGLNNAINEWITGNKIETNKLNNEYILYSEVDPKCTYQNSIFHKYIGNIVLTGNNIELNKNDIDYLQTYCNNVLLKKKRTFIFKKQKVEALTKKVRTGIYIN